MLWLYSYIVQLLCSVFVTCFMQILCYALWLNNTMPLPRRARRKGIQCVLIFMPVELFYRLNVKKSPICIHQKTGAPSSSEINLKARSKLRSTKEDVQKKALLFGPARYIRTYDVISEVNCVVPRRMFEIKRSCLTQHAISELMTLYPK